MSKLNHKIFEEYNWDTFMKACLEMNCTEFYMETYPLIGEYCDKYGYNKDMLLKFIEKAVKSEGKKYQDCMDDLIRIMLDGARYSHESFGYDAECIKYLLQKGATLPEEKIFYPRYNLSKNDHVTYEDEIYDYHIRGKIIDVFHTQMNVIKYANWPKIACKYWEQYMDNEITDEKRFAYLKYCSKYLCQTYPNVNDSDGDEIGIDDSDSE